MAPFLLYVDVDERRSNTRTSDDIDLHEEGENHGRMASILMKRGEHHGQTASHLERKRRHGQTARQLQLGEVQASWKNLMTIPPRRGEVFPNGLDDGVRAPSNGAPAFSSNSLAMSVRKVAGSSKMIE
uniref:Uncharacterized protein n=1 Tax=Oryza barthii TaxID=65489 RepID=A0A0D3FM43_9ORYZ